MTEDDWRTIEEAVAASDPDRYVASFFAPSGRRRALLALAAFDRELARIGETVREPMVGHIRLSWWREQVGAIYDGRKPASPVAEALADTVRTYGLPRDLVDGAIDARGHDLDETPFADEAALEAHADLTAGNIIRLGARVLEAQGMDDEAVRDAAIAAALTGHLRDLLRLARLRRCRLPLAWLNDERLNAEDVFEGGEPSPALRRVFSRAQARSKAALDAANAKRFPRRSMPVIATATLARVTIDPSNPEAITPWQRVSRLAAAILLRRL